MIKSRNIVQVCLIFIYVFILKRICESIHGPIFHLVVTAVLNPFLVYGVLVPVVTCNATENSYGLLSLTIHRKKKERKKQNVLLTGRSVRIYFLFKPIGQYRNRIRLSLSSENT